MSEIHNKIVSYFDNKENPIILDLGTYLLEDISVFAEQFPNSICFAFEADPRNIANIRKSKYPSNVNVIEGAIGNTDGLVDFYPSEKIDWTKNWNLSGSIRKPKEHLTEYTVSFGKSFSINCQRLDTWYKGSSIYRKPIELIYSDLNGAEGDMLMGGTETLRNTHLIYVECFDKELYGGQKNTQWIHEYLSNLGFDYLFDNGNNRLYRNKSNG